MTRRKQNLVLFFQENEESNVINSRLVRLYMNRFTIDEDDETEVTQVHNVKTGTQEEYEECFSKSLKIARENETPRTDYHFIIGCPTVNDNKKSWYAKMWSFFRWSETDSLIFKFSQLIANNQSRLENCYAVTLLHGSNSLKFFSEKNIKIAYQYQKQDDKYEENSFWRKIFYGMNFVTERFERSINDDLEWFHCRILDSGMSNTNRINERIQTFHYQMQDDDQMKYLKNLVDKHNNQSLFKRLRAYYSMAKTDSNYNYARFNCIRVTMYSNNGTMEKFLFLLIEILMVLITVALIIHVFHKYLTISKSVLVNMILILLIFYYNYCSYFYFFSVTMFILISANDLYNTLHLYTCAHTCTL